MWKWVLVSLFLGHGALAQELVDMEALLAQHADEVVVVTDAEGRPERRLVLENGQRITCDEQRCWGFDPEGATGCLWMLVGELRAVAEICELPLGPQRDVLMSTFTRLAAHVGENAIPPRSLAEMEGFYQQRLQSERRRSKGPLGLSCDEAGKPESDLIRMMNGFLDPRNVKDLTNYLAKPRLPLTNPCL
jgi:hypothetical protein